MSLTARTRTLLGLGLILCLVVPPAIASADRRKELRSHSRSADHKKVQKLDEKLDQRRWRRPIIRLAQDEHPRGWRHEHRLRRQHRICELLAARHPARADHAVRASSRDAVFRFLAPLFGCKLAEPAPTMAQAPPPLATLVDANGAAFADLGVVETDHATIQVPAASPLVEPVVILGPPTRREADPGMPEIQVADSDGFQVRFREWNYLDGVHAVEAMSYLILAPGRHVLADGSEWEVGSLEIPEADTFFTQAFRAPFSAPPALFLTVQSRNDADPVVVRARRVTQDGFETALMEELGADGSHGSERVGYLAISSPAGSGRLLSSSTDLPYLVREIVSGHLPVPVLSGSLAMEKETSVDVAIDHPDEALATLAIGSQVFAQAVTSEGVAPASVRRIAPVQDAGVEWGTVTGIDELWHTIPLSREYVDPVVIVGPVSRNGLEPGVLRIRNVRADAFELRFQEWAYLDGRHLPERVFYLVAERGLQSIGGLMMEAGHTDSSALLREGLQSVSFAMPFPETPAVFASVMTNNDPQPVNVRMSDRAPGGFGMAMQAEQADRTAHGVERLGWVAIQPGEGSTSDGRTLRVFETIVDHRVTTVPLGDLRGRRFPVVLGQITSVFGFDPVTLRFESLTADGIGLFAAEEKSQDPEIEHTNAETVSILVAE